MHTVDRSETSAARGTTASRPETWLIRIQGYGTFEFTGTEAEAEEMRAHKSRWEQGNGIKWRTGEFARPSDAVTAEIAAIWDSRRGVPQSLLSRRHKLLKEEALADVGEPSCSSTAADRSGNEMKTP